ncbi:flagellar export protein FliJ [Amphibacillus sediminis]|uniref:flagellar export protein FliJ n=1 Tax=Amphibacillus sediminis TaxID=360185 RepID=UPI00082E2D11|nr:flagellar export protein FliJ [Amphibacillus sediminis]
MTSIRAFNKIRDHQERIKNQAQLDYQEALHEFELVAEQLYLLLQKKEQVEKEYSYYLASSGTVKTLATHYAFIEQIKKKIDIVQTELNQKRFVMERKQQKLTSAHVEVKKFEKIIEKKHLKRQMADRYRENQTNDEIASRMYLNHGNR